MAILAQNSLQDQELKERSRREFGRTMEKGGFGQIQLAKEILSLIRQSTAEGQIFEFTQKQTESSYTQCTQCVLMRLG